MKTITRTLTALLTGLFLLFSCGITISYAASHPNHPLLLAHDDHDGNHGWSSSREDEDHYGDDEDSSSHHVDHGEGRDPEARHRHHDNTLYWLKMISYVVGIAIGIVIAGGG